MDKKAAPFVWLGAKKEIYLATSCFMGYGLFDQAMVPLATAKERFGALICSDMEAMV